MRVRVKKPRINIEISGRSPKRVIEVLRKHFDIEVESDSDVVPIQGVRLV